MRGLAHPVIALVAAVAARPIARLVDVDARAGGAEQIPSRLQPRSRIAASSAMLHSGASAAATSFG